MKRLVMSCAVTLSCLILAASAPLTRVDPAALKFKTDLRVDTIHSSHCPTNGLTGIDALYVANILVDVSNHKAGGIGAPTPALLTVTYFDVMQGKMVTITKDLPQLNPYPTIPWIIQRICVVNQPLLIKKSVGITATIKPKMATINDPVPANNVKLVKKCTVMIQ